MFIIDFQSQYRMLPEHRQDLKKAYDHRGGRWLYEKFYKLRNSKSKQVWIQPETAEELIQKWGHDEKFQNKSAKNKQNMAKMDKPSYTGGSIPISEYKQKIVSACYFLFKYSIFCTMKQLINGHHLCL